jgi:hypothetical protein
MEVTVFERTQQVDVDKEVKNNEANEMDRLAGQTRERLA